MLQLCANYDGLVLFSPPRLHKTFSLVLPQGTFLSSLLLMRKSGTLNCIKLGELRRSGINIDGINYTIGLEEFTEEALAADGDGSTLQLIGN